MKQDVMKQDAMKQSAKKRFAVLIVVACLGVGALVAIFTKGGVSDAEIAAEPYVGYPSFPELTHFHFMETSYQQRVAQRAITRCWYSGHPSWISRAITARRIWQRCSERTITVSMSWPWGAAS